MGKTHFKRWTDYIVPRWTPSRFKSWWVFYQGLVDVKEGRIPDARKKHAEISSYLPDMNEYYRGLVSHYSNLLLGEIYIAEGKPEKVYEILHEYPINRFNPLAPGYMCSCNAPFMQDVLARAYVQAGDIDKAIAEYKMLIVFKPNSKDLRLINPRYHCQLAKLHQQKGQLQEAKEEYEKFLKIWKNADSDLSDFMDAKARLVSLKKK